MTFQQARANELQMLIDNIARIEECVLLGDGRGILALVNDDHRPRPSGSRTWEDRYRDLWADEFNLEDDYDY